MPQNNIVNNAYGNTRIIDANRTRDLTKIKAVKASSANETLDTELGTLGFNAKQLDRMSFNDKIFALRESKDLNP